MKLNIKFIFQESPDSPDTSPPSSPRAVPASSPKGQEFSGALCSSSHCSHSASNAPEPVTSDTDGITDTEQMSTDNESEELEVDISRRAIQLRSQSALPGI